MGEERRIRLDIQQVSKGFQMKNGDRRQVVDQLSL